MLFTFLLHRRVACASQRLGERERVACAYQRLGERERVACASQRVDEMERVAVLCIKCAISTTPIHCAI